MCWEGMKIKVSLRLTNKEMAVPEGLSLLSGSDRHDVRNRTQKSELGGRRRTPGSSF